MAKVEETVDSSRLGDIRKRLGNHLPNDWVLTTLGEAFKWGSGGTPKRTDTRFYGGDVPWLIIGDLTDGVVTHSATTITEKGLKESSAKWVDPGSILLAMYGSIGKLGIAGRRVTTNQAIAFTKPDPVDAKYLFYYLMYTRSDLASLGKGATQKNISQTVIKAFPFVLAPQDQQKRIVEEIEKQFSRLDEAVANLKRVKANLKRYKAAVLKAAVEGRLVEPSSGSVQRESLGNLGDWCGGGTPSKAIPRYWEGGEIPWVSPKDMKTDVISDAADHITAMAVNNSATHLLPKGAVLVVTRSGILRHTLPVAITTAAVAINQDLKALQPSDAYDPEFVALALRAQQQEILHQCGKEGTTVQSIEFPRFLRYEIPIPTLIDQKLIVMEVARRLSLVRGTEAQVDADITCAERFRQSLLATAFSGKLRQIVARKIGDTHG